MALIQIRGGVANTKGELPAVGSTAPDFRLTKSDLSSVSNKDFAGKKVVLNIFLSVDTGTCAKSVHTFNKKASSLDNTVVLCVSPDLPFALNRFCGAEGIENLVMLSAFKDPSFGLDYGVTFADGPLESLFSRAVVILNEKGKVIYREHVSNISKEPDYEQAMNALKNG